MGQDMVFSLRNARAGACGQSLTSSVPFKILPEYKVRKMLMFPDSSDPSNAQTLALDAPASSWKSWVSLIFSSPVPYFLLCSCAGSAQ